jgi:RNA recognition motif-containing protein
MAKGKLSLSLNFSHHLPSFSFVEFETPADLKTAVEKLDGQTFKGATVHCIADVSFLPRDLIYSF